MSTSATLLTVADFLNLPDPTEGHLELHHGEPVVMPPPTWGHQLLQSRIASLLEAQLGETGIVMTGMFFRPTPEYELWQADVGYVTTERVALIGGEKYLMGAPDLVVEVLSPSNTAQEIHDRQSICMSNGCLSFWVVNDRRKVISISEGDVTKHYRASSRLQCSLLAAESIAVADIFV